MKEIKNYTAEKYKKKFFQILNKREYMNISRITKCCM